MEFGPNFTYMLYSATAEGSVYHKDTDKDFHNSSNWSYCSF
jgi:hypothetical protein